MMHYTVYKITNIFNEKIYIGVHRTNNSNDHYMGSGVLIKKALSKYGRSNFKKEILFETDDIDLAFQKEYELTEGLTLDNSYNMIRGGIRVPPANHDQKEVRRNAARKGGLNNKSKPKSFSHRKKISESLRGKTKEKYHRQNNRPHSEETKEKLRQKAIERWAKRNSASIVDTARINSVPCQ